MVSAIQNAVETIKKLKGEDALGGQNTLIGRFKTGNDGSNYLGWGWISAKTNSELLNIYQSELTQVQERIKFNTQDTKW